VSSPYYLLFIFIFRPLFLLFQRDGNAGLNFYPPYFYGREKEGKFFLSGGSRVEAENNSVAVKSK
jgi:hypothetical protein